MTDQPASRTDLDRLEGEVDGWLADLRAANPAIDAVERGEPGERRWYVRMHGEERAVFTVWLTLRQRNLHHETYVVPAPRERAGELYEHLLRRNRDLQGVAFAIGAEDAAYLVGALPVALLDADALDEVLGVHYEAVERCFGPAMRIGFGSSFRPS